MESGSGFASIRWLQIDIGLLEFSIYLSLKIAKFYSCRRIFRLRKLHITPSKVPKMLRGVALKFSADSYSLFISDIHWNIRKCYRFCFSKHTPWESLHLLKFRVQRNSFKIRVVQREVVRECLSRLRMFETFGSKYDENKENAKMLLISHCFH